MKRRPEVIVVTAQRRVQTLIDVPQSITVVGGDTLERQQATTFQDYLSSFPASASTRTTRAKPV